MTKIMQNRVIRRSLCGILKIHSRYIPSLQFSPKEVPPMNILIIEDDPAISRLLALTLTNAGYACRTCPDGDAAPEQIDTFAPDLILLDVMLPGTDGFGLLEYIRPLGIPTIMVTARDETDCKVRGLREGADDYLTKPFQLAELLARVEAVLRRAGKLQAVWQEGDLSVDLTSRRVTRAGEPVPLTNKEYELLTLFLQNQGTALCRDVILERVWGFDYDGADSRTLDLHVQRLRKKLGWQERITTIRRYGYRLER